MSDLALKAAPARSMQLDPELRETIQSLMVDYASAIDNDDLEEWPEFFVEKCLYKIVSRSNHEAGRPAGFVYCDNRRMLIDRVLSLRSANVYQPHLYRHILSPSKILARSNGSVSAETNFAVIRTSLPDGTMTTFSTGRYLDEIVLDSDGAKFRSRTVVTDSDAIDILLVIPI
jgi:anthranilate 1,2-dioxygenase small subunit